ncbi:transposase, Ptta/En/Spm, transposase, Tnp1/En/Spm-like protein [Tanacetum coccineum]
MAFVSSPSTTNEFNTSYVVSTANTQVSPASTQVSTASTQVSTANLSAATIYAFVASQPNGSQLVHKDLKQFHEDDLEEMDLKWQLALLSMRTRRFFQKTSRNITINGSDTAGTGIKDSSWKEHNVEETFQAMLLLMELVLTGAIWQMMKSLQTWLLWLFQTSDLDKLIGSQITDNGRKGVGFVSYNVVPPPHTGLFSPPTIDLSNSGLEEFQQPEFEVYRPKTSKSAHCNYHQRKRVVSENNYTRVNYNYYAKKAHPSAHRNMAPRVVLMKAGLRPLNTARTVYTTHPKSTVYSARPCAFNTAKGKFYTARPNSAVVNVVRAHQASSINYALTVKPTIYTSCIEQFWVTAKAKTVNGEHQLQALVDKKKGRSIEDIDKDAEVTLVDETQERSKVYIWGNTVLEVNIAATKVGDVRATTTTTVPLTISRAKSIVFREPTTKTTPTIVPSNIKDKGKAKMVEPEVPLKIKDQFRLDEELARKLEVEELEAEENLKKAEAEVKSAKAKMARSKCVFPHTMGRGGYAHVKEKMIEKKEIEQDEEPTRGTLWLKGRVNKDGEYQDDEIRSVGDKLKETEDKIKEGTLQVDQGTDAMTLVLGKEKGGYARGVGSGVTYKRYFDLPRSKQAADERILLLESQLDAARREREEKELLIKSMSSKMSQTEGMVTKLKNQLAAQGGQLQSTPTQLTPLDVSPVEIHPINSSADEEGGTTVVGCDQNDASIRKEMQKRETVKSVGAKKTTRSIRKDSSSQDSQSKENVSVLPQAIKCRLWHLKKTTIIAEGTVYKSDGKIMLHNKALPKDCYKVSIDKSLVDAAFIPDVGSNGCTTVLDAVGGFVAWPKNQVVLDPKATPPSTIQMITGENKTSPKVQTKCKNVYVFSDAMQKEANKKRSHKALVY